MVCAGLEAPVTAAADAAEGLHRSPHDFADPTESPVSTFRPLAVSSVAPLGHRGLQRPPSSMFGPIGRSFAAGVGVKTSLAKSRCSLGLAVAPSHL